MKKWLFFFFFFFFLLGGGGVGVGWGGASGGGEGVWVDHLQVFFGALSKLTFFLVGVGGLSKFSLFLWVM